MNLQARQQYVSKPIDSFVPRSTLGTNNQSIILKVMEDIRFLEDRIDRMKKLHQPNAVVLNTYQSMLDSRESVLKWLHENDDEKFEEEDQLENLG